MQDYIKKLLKEKECNIFEKPLISYEKEKLNIIYELIQVPDWPFNLSMENVIGILEFLGVADDKILDVYNRLISFEEFQKTNNEVLFYDPKI